MDSEKVFYAPDRKSWRAWLKKNHSKEKRVALLKYRKHTGKPALSHKESMEEAICFGWIDTTIKKLDHDRYIRHFVRRGPKANWSTATLSYAKRLIREKRMAPAGLAAYKLGLKKLPFDHDIPKDPPVPEDLKQALEKDQKSKENFDNLAPSYRRTYLRWLFRAKQSATREKRINSILLRVRDNKKFGL